MVGSAGPVCKLYGSCVLVSIVHLFSRPIVSYKCLACMCVVVSDVSIGEGLVIEYGLTSIVPPLLQVGLGRWGREGRGGREMYQVLR